MPFMTRRTLGASAAALIFAATTAQAQQMSSPMGPTTPPVRIRATIETVSGTMLTAKSRDGAELKVKLADNGPVNEVVPQTLADIKDSSYIAVTAMPQPDGSQKAVAILIFPEAMRGVGEGFRPWDLEANSTMTNATVAEQVKSTDGQTITVKYKDGDKKVLVTPATIIVTYKKAAASDLKAGQKIFVAAAKKLDDGTLEAPNVAYGDVGVWR
jgi:ABC-type enterochelin transport system substrate-binding protein